MSRARRAGTFASSRRAQREEAMMPGPRNQWIRPMLLVAIVYAVVGIVTADLAGAAPSRSDGHRLALAAWLLSLVAFASHIAYEQFRLRSEVRATATHVATAVALGAFLLAAAGPGAQPLGRGRFLARLCAVTSAVAHSHRRACIPGRARGWSGPEAARQTTDAFELVFDTLSTTRDGPRWPCRASRGVT